MTEAAFQARVIEWARRNGWLVAHFPRSPSPRQDGRWLTAVAGDAKGFPDLTLVRPPGHLYAELKSEKGRLRPDQKVWIEALKAAGMEVYVWRPSDWWYIERRLARRG